MTAGIDHTRKGDVVEMPIEEFERLEATLELLENEALKSGILTSLEEYKRGKSRPWDEARDDI